MQDIVAVQPKKEKSKKKKSRNEFVDNCLLSENSSGVEKKEKKKKSKLIDTGECNGLTNGHSSHANCNDQTESPIKKRKRKKDESQKHDHLNDSHDLLHQFESPTSDVEVSDVECDAHPDHLSPDSPTVPDAELDDPEVAEQKKLGNFSNFTISPSTASKLEAKNIKYLFPVQYETFNHIYEGEDIIVQARTGTGKTLAFALPLVEKLQSDGMLRKGKLPKVLVLTPTRELAKQVCTDFESVSSIKLRLLCIYGGVSYVDQLLAIKRGLDIVVGTPGRIIDLMERNLDFSEIRHVILDEVDRMLDMGFCDDVESIISKAFEQDKKPQTLLFSATLPTWVDATAKKYMTPNVRRLDLVGQQTIKTALSVTHMAMLCAYPQRATMISDIVSVYSGAHGRAIVFCQTKKEADKLVTSGEIKLSCDTLHGDIVQSKRETVLNAFKKGHIKVLVCTDVAARGLDIPSVDVVIQCSPPSDIESYIHRSGRTGRAGRTGISILLYNSYEEWALQNVEYNSGITFVRMDPPQTYDILNAVGSDARESIKKVPKKMINHFTDEAEKLSKELGPTDALAAALAVISGYEKLSERSLLCSMQDYTTWLLHCDTYIHFKGAVFKLLERIIPSFDSNIIRNLRIFASGQGAAFDIPNELNDSFSSYKGGQNYGWRMELAEDLPPLMPEQKKTGTYRGSHQSWNSQSYSRGRGRGRGGRGGNGFRGGRGGNNYGGNRDNRFNYLKRSNRTYGEPANKRIKF